MDRIYVLYDPVCEVCRRCMQFLRDEPKLVSIEGLPRDGLTAARLFPDLDRSADDLVVVSGEGAVYSGADAFIVCLWALRDYRGWADRLSRPTLRPLARRALESFSRHRGVLSGFLRGSDEELRDRLQASEELCDDGLCAP
ncbi:MAG: DUF393 domain-containing protein [Deltaproteobacteria bacterium]|nr:DUF393 domain-containing protein [Deltaproteobacteria bacterium]